MVGLISVQHIFFLFFGVGRTQMVRPRPTWLLADPTTMQSNYAAAMERPRYLTLECLNGGLAGRDGEGLTWGRWLRLWQRWWPVAEEAKEEEENGRGCREERERFTVALGGRLVASCGGADGGKTNDEGGGGWRPQRREKEEKGPVAGKLSREGWFLAIFGPDFLLLQDIKPASIYRRWKRVISSTPG